MYVRDALAPRTTAQQDGLTCLLVPTADASEGYVNEGYVRGALAPRTTAQQDGLTCLLVPTADA